MTESGWLLRARIDTQALRHNLGRVRRAAPSSRVMAVIKANAYGHGTVRAAMALAEADAFAVARVEEAAELRAAGVGHPLVLLEGAANALQMQQAAHLHLQLVVHDFSQLDLLAAAHSDHRFVVWVKLNSGMNRLGFPSEQLQEVWRRLRALPARVAELRLMSHLACADEPGHPLTALQQQRFWAAHASLASAVQTSLGNSAGLFTAAALQGDWVRPGIALYGISPFATKSASELGLRPAMTFESTVIAVYNIAAGDTVGYGGRWQAQRATRVAIIAAGYADGVPRHLPNGAPVLVQGHRGALVGRVSMDMLAVDVSGLDKVQVGSKAVLWGAGLPAEEVAAAAGTIGYELCARLGRRVVLEYD